MSNQGSGRGPPRPPSKPPDTSSATSSTTPTTTTTSLSSTSRTIPNNGVSGAQGTAALGTGYAAAVANSNTSIETKWLEVHMFKSEKGAKLQMSEEEHAKIIEKLNINPRQLHTIDDHLKTVLYLRVDASLDLATVNLHEAIPVRKGLRTKPLRQHAHLEFIKLYKCAATDPDEAIAEMLSAFGEVLSISNQTYQP